MPDLFNFDSLSGGYVPICIATLIAAWFVSTIRLIALRVVAACLAPMAISLAWSFVPAMMANDPGADGWIAWGVIAAATWSIAAVPLGVAATLGLSLARQPRGSKNPRLDRI